MDSEVIFWCVLGVGALFILTASLFVKDYDEPVSENTLKRLRDKRTH